MGVVTIEVYCENFGAFKVAGRAGSIFHTLPAPNAESIRAC
jgi:hypothetical protein